MQHFEYRDGRLHAEDVDLAEIAAEVGTPFYCYSTATLTRHFRVFSEAFAGQNALVCYAMKANSNQAVLKTLVDLGAGMDVVSEGELRRALAAGTPPQKIIFSGVGKTRAEMALRSGSRHPLLQRRVRARTGGALRSRRIAERTRARIAIRVNPDVDAHTHAKISTGKSENKFGVPISRAREVYARAKALPGIEIDGVDMHIGSQITELHAVRRRVRAACRVRRRAARRRAHDPPRRSRRRSRRALSLRQRPAAAPRALRRDRRAPHCAGSIAKCFWSPAGSSSATPACSSTSVIYVKRGEGKNFVIVDAAMNDLIRPTLYEAHHEIRPYREPRPDEPRIVADVVGPVCESGDYLALDRDMAEPRAGDLIAVLTAGAYGAVQAGTYNTRPLVPEVLVNGDRFAVVRPRPSYAELIGLDKLPPWLA